MTIHGYSPLWTAGWLRLIAQLEVATGKRLKNVTNSVT
jgi:hypothetical protein